MRTISHSSKLLIGMFFSFTSLQSYSQSDTDSTGLPGDNFSLQGALEMFRKAGSPEAFEKLLNTEDNKVNNLDLDGDGNTDYIRVIDKTENGVHAFVLQAIVSQNESQDIAVIELEKTGENNAVLQIVGDEDIYGEETIIEPSEETDNAFAPVGYETTGGPSFQSSGIIVNVWAWPAVRFVYAPAYVVWVSPWKWRAYPVWYKPWKPLHWHAFHPYRYHYRNRYVVVHTHRVVPARRIYKPVRVTSVTVRTHNQVAVTRYRTNRTAPHRSVSASRRTTKVERGQGNRKVSTTRTKTTVRKKRH